MPDTRLNGIQTTGPFECERAKYQPEDLDFENLTA